MRTLKPGDRVRLTGKFLQNTGQLAGPEGLSRWTITGIDERLGWAITDQLLDAGLLRHFTAEELAADPSLRFRRIALAHLERAP